MNEQDQTLSLTGRTFIIFGAGYSGKAIGAALVKQGARVFGTTRHEGKFSEIFAIGMTPLIFNGKWNAALLEAMAKATDCIMSIAPGDDDPLLSLIEGSMKRYLPKLRWCAYLSTVGVYGNHDGAWVDEETQCRPVSKRSIQRVDAEAAWQQMMQGLDVPLSIIRLSGIYGPGRNTFKKIEAGEARRLVKPDQVFNRIRVEDIGAATTLLATQKSSGIYNVTDDLPAPPQDVVTFACALLGITPPEEQDFDTADLTPMARSFYGENKRVSNAKIKALGFVFTYPNYKQSLEQLYKMGLEKHNLAMAFRSS